MKFRRKYPVKISATACSSNGLPDGITKHKKSVLRHAVEKFGDTPGSLK
jgi:hypothetical protein